jgi:hypothetical protein
MKKLLIFSACIFWCFAQCVFAQEQEAKRTAGLSALMQEGQFDIMLPYWLDDKTVIAPAIGMQYVQDAGTDVAVGFAFKCYSTIKRVTPYYGVRIGVMAAFAEGEGESKTDLLAGLLYGAECFVLPQFSIGIEAQLNLTKSADNSSRFGNPGGINVNTAAALLASIYF